MRCAPERSLLSSIALFCLILNHSIVTYAFDSARRSWLRSVCRGRSTGFRWVRNFRVNEPPSGLPSRPPSIMISRQNIVLLSFGFHRCSIICRRSPASKETSSQIPARALALYPAEISVFQLPFTNSLSKSWMRRRWFVAVFICNSVLQFD